MTHLFATYFENIHEIILINICHNFKIPPDDAKMVSFLKLFAKPSCEKKKDLGIPPSVIKVECLS